MSTRQRVLCIGVHLQGLVTALRSADYEVMQVSTSSAALAIAQLFPPAAIVLRSEHTYLLPKILRNFRVPVLLADSHAPDNWKEMPEKISSALKLAS